MSVTDQLLKSAEPSKQLSQLGLDLGPLKSADEAIRKGAIAAMAPPAQNAVLIYLLFANTTMQEMAWKGCKPDGGQP